LATLGDRLRALREEEGYSQADLGRLLTLSQSTIAFYESGKREPSPGTLRQIADFYQVSVDYLIGRTNHRATLTGAVPAPSKSIPILGTIRAGIPVLAEENWDGEIEVPASLKADFALRISGDSMTWAGIHDGDLAILRRSDSASPGMIVAAGIEEGTWSATFKYYIKENGHAVLRAANPEYQDVTVTPNHRVIGYAVAVLKEPPMYSHYKSLLMRKDLHDRKWQLAMEIAQQHGLDGEKVANLIALFGQTVRHIK